MSFRVFSFIVLFTLPLTAIPEPKVNPQPYDFLRSQHLKLCVPPCPFSSDALEIQNIGNHQRFRDWTVLEHLESYDMLQRIRSCWDRCDYTHSYLVYGQTSPNLRSETFHWQIIPYPDNEWYILKQIGVIWNVSFGASALSESERIAQASDTKVKLETLNDTYTISSDAAKGDDPFCQSKTIDKQCIHEGQEMRVLYDYAPVKVLEENPHFLIVPKKHRETFNELTSSEYAEAMMITNKISDYFQQAHPQSTLHLLHKTGREAGQTVPHWHLHVIAVKEDAYLPAFDFPCVKNPTSCTRLDSPFRHISQKFGQLCQSCLNFVYLMLPQRKLPQEELAQRVEFYSREIEF